MTAAARGTEAGDSVPPTDGEAVEPRQGVIGPFTLRQLALINLIVGLAAVVLFVATRPIGEPTLSSPVPGATFYRISVEGEGLQIGQRAPDFVGRNSDQDVRLADLDGREIRMADLGGRPVWLVFWATWCPPCQQETPDIRSAYEAHRDDGLVVLAIDIQEPAETVREYVWRYELGYRVGLDTNAAIMKTYGVFGLPTHYFIDRAGVIRERYFGPLDRQSMERRIDLISQP